MKRKIFSYFVGAELIIGRCYPAKKYSRPVISRKTMYFPSLRHFFFIGIPIIIKYRLVAGGR